MADGKWSDGQWLSLGGFCHLSGHHPTDAPHFLGAILE
jgi:hypothetical protein